MQAHNFERHLLRAVDKLNFNSIQLNVIWKIHCVCLDILLYYTRYYVLYVGILVDELKPHSTIISFFLSWLAGLFILLFCACFSFLVPNNDDNIKKFFIGESRLLFSFLVKFSIVLPFRWFYSKKTKDDDNKNISCPCRVRGYTYLPSSYLNAKYFLSHFRGGGGGLTWSE